MRRLAPGSARRSKTSASRPGTRPRRCKSLKGKYATVVVFLSFDCPISTNYSEALAELAKTYGPKGVTFIGVVPSDDEDAAAVAKKAEEFKLTFPVFKDEKLKAADALKAEATPEVFVLDARPRRCAIAAGSMTATPPGSRRNPARPGRI